MEVTNGHIGLAIKSLAKERNLSVETLANRLGVVRQSVYDAFEKETLLPKTIDRYAKALELTSEDILRKSGKISVNVSQKEGFANDSYMLRRLADLEDMVVFLKAQLTEKDNQIRTLLGKSDSVFLAGFVPLFFLVFGYKFGYTY